MIEKTIGALFDYIRELVANKILESQKRIGAVENNGIRKILEIDESVFLRETIIEMD